MFDNVWLHENKNNLIKFLPLMIKISQYKFNKMKNNN